MIQTTILSLVIIGSLLHALSFPLRAPLHLVHKYIVAIEMNYLIESGDVHTAGLLNEEERSSNDRSNKNK